MAKKIIIKCRTLVEGEVEGLALVTKEPISFYGGVDPETGVVIDKSHPLYGKKISGRILFFPYGKGSTVGSYIIYRLAKKGLAPLAIVNVRSEPIILIGCLLSSIPLVDKVNMKYFDIVKDNSKVKVIAKREYGLIEVEV